MNKKLQVGECQIVPLIPDLDLERILSTLSSSHAAGERDRGLDFAIGSDIERGKGDGDTVIAGGAAVFKTLTLSGPPERPRARGVVGLVSALRG